ncbi:MAG: DUF1178 family protein [Aromatoleum sp.]|uniref:DUF1178 family protein n=1 Tax=Aromatoleum sp. TaxID=2307007 RepID=UPI0028938BE5|nr:DUF1178 family protein [Aromatoleum sp.]MDT3671705.1 DUF1178 family protein [Aromatoleum sp.]
MIVLNLCCDNEHLFEGWFASADAFETQLGRQQVSCPVCGSAQIERRPAAPYVNTGSGVSRQPPAAPNPIPVNADALAAALAMLRRLGKESEDVGERFAEEARRIHYGDSDARNIKGKATRDDVGELLDEGIMVLPLSPDDDELH